MSRSPRQAVFVPRFYSDTPCRNTGIPPGRVKQGIQRFSADPSNDACGPYRATSTTLSEHTSRPRKIGAFLVSSIDGQNEASHEACPRSRSISELDAVKEPTPKHEPRELCVEEVRGRDTTPVLVHDDATQVDVQDGQVIEDVRQRLESLQQIVRREQSRSSVARDGLMDELGDMLDTAIATTMAPTNLPSSQLSRSISMKSSHSPTKLPRSVPNLSRSQSARGTGRAEGTIGKFLKEGEQVS